MPIGSCLPGVRNSYFATNRWSGFIAGRRVMRVVMTPFQELLFQTLSCQCAWQEGRVQHQSTRKAAPPYLIVYRRRRMWRNCCLSGRLVSIVLLFRLEGAHVSLGREGNLLLSQQQDCLQAHASAVSGVQQDCCAHQGGATKVQGQAQQKLVRRAEHIMSASVTDDDVNEYAIDSDWIDIDE